MTSDKMIRHGLFGHGMVKIGCLQAVFRCVLIKSIWSLIFNIVADFYLFHCKGGFFQLSKTKPCNKMTPPVLVKLGPSTLSMHMVQLRQDDRLFFSRNGCTEAVYLWLIGGLYW